MDIFERVNGGVPLTRQQMRNCLYMGPATLFLKQEAATQLFREATGGSLRSKTMRDREFVNRFCAFQINTLQEYREMDDFLALALRKMNRFSRLDLDRLSSELRLGLENNYTLFGEHAFRKGTISRHIICSGQLFAQFFRSHPEELPEAQRGQLQAQQAVRRLILSVPGPELV